MTNNNKLTKGTKELESLRNQVKDLKIIAKERKQLNKDIDKETGNK